VQQSSILVVLPSEALPLFIPLQAALEDWHRDTVAPPFKSRPRMMEEENFTKSMFELTDQWTLTVSPVDYVQVEEHRSK
jgi:hypothetical protein